jgi:hypothetical protein
MSSYIYNKRLPAKAKAARSSLSALVSNNLADGYTSTDLTKQVIRSDTHLRLLSYLYTYGTSEHLLYSPAMSK